MTDEMADVEDLSIIGLGVMFWETMVNSQGQQSSECVILRVVDRDQVNQRVVAIFG